MRRDPDKAAFQIAMAALKISLAIHHLIPVITFHHGAKRS